ncbi:MULTISPECIES: amino acid ABC transporter permease [unclassified Bosea (in: a-proteobacteria)]|uniref:amino acid ABC transporter permease n=1 Tax=unclassified Bosea (in: a-proteobacteria) TaxID=2653178 RepID=UPI000F74C568|nr:MULTISPECIES: amino acid ABC transporter permease [unclassified Bosea (in: a-proteobacteria)]AZO77593.1 amino acid ABC transporter permease [Bosea sp. Tri-49]
MSTTSAEIKPGKASLLYDPKIRGYVYQFALLAVVGFLIWSAASNAIENLRAQKIASGFGFWHNAAGFDVNQKLIPFSASGSTYGQAFWVGLLNTLLVASIGIVLSTFLGFFVGVARLSSNWIVSKLAMIYVEVIRNLPLLLQLFFWYNAVLKPLPNPRQSIELPAGFLLNNRGLYVPDPQFGPGGNLIIWALLIGLVATFVFRFWARKQQAATGKQYPIGLVAFGLIIVLPLLVYFATGRPITFVYPELAGFNLRGGIQIFPEFVALLVGLTTYTAGFIAEVVRAGILAVSKGQTEAANALGLRAGPTLKLVVIPQAMRVIIPPLTSNYLNLTKNSSLAVAIGYPDLVQVFTGTVLNQTGQAVEVVAITMAVYLTISLVTSFFMNIYNKRMALVER